MQSSVPVVIFPFSRPVSDGSFWYSFFQREFSLFLSVEEYQITDARNGLFEEYLQRYLGYTEGKESDDAEEKVTIQWEKQ